MKSQVEKLLLRGNKLRDSLSRNEITKLQQIMGLELGNSFQKLYSTFNGFNAADRRSQIFLWGLDEVCRRLQQEPNLREGDFVAIGDILIDSDFLMADISRDNKPIYLLHEKREIGNSLEDFLIHLTSGEMDFHALN